MAKHKIAILGGGVAGAVAAYWLTRTEALREKYEVTLYQMGWRLGGKGASGRNRQKDYGDRSEEHGVHVWFGLYENAFCTLRECYKRMGAHGPFPTIDEAFLPADEAVLADLYKGQWDMWKFTWPRKTDGKPGDGKPLPTLWEYAWRALDWLLKNLNHHRDWVLTLEKREKPKEWPLAWSRRVLGFVRRLWRHPRLALKKAPTYLHLVVQLIDSLPADPRKYTEKETEKIIDLLGKFLGDFFAFAGGDAAKLSSDKRRLLVTFDLALTALRGALKDRVFKNGLDSIDGEDFQAWLRRHGARFPDVGDSALVRSLYGAPFAYEDGDPQKANMAAGAGLRALCRIFFGYKEAYLYKMQAGMGEIVFTPIYKALEGRAEVRFFHKVENLGLSADKKWIETIRLNRQARVSAATGKYDPLITVDLGATKFECWPADPKTELLDPTTLPVPGDPGFESAWSQHVGEKITLQRGVNFDSVILAIPPAAHPHIASELIAASPTWKTMVDKVKSIRTVAAQLWLLPKADALGWDPQHLFVEPPLIGGYVDEFNIIMDECVVLATETWKQPAPPQSLFYLCGPMKEDPKPEPPHSVPGYPDTQRQVALALARLWFATAAERLWPKVSVPGTGGLDWTKAFDPEDRAGDARFDGQYVRCNIDPAERYVLSLAGTTEFRIGHRRKPGGTELETSGFENLFVAGDWTRNGVNVGCVEAATVSAMQAVRAICGEPKDIPGEEDVTA